MISTHFIILPTTLVLSSLVLHFSARSVKTTLNWIDMKLNWLWKYCEIWDNPTAGWNETLLLLYYSGLTEIFTDAWLHFCTPPVPHLGYLGYIYDKYPILGYVFQCQCSITFFYTQMMSIDVHPFHHPAYNSSIIQFSCPFLICSSRLHFCTSPVPHLR